MRGSAEVADVVVGLGHADLKTGIGGHAELVAGGGCFPLRAASDFVFAGAEHAFHDFGGTDVERQCGGQDHAHGLACAIGIGDGVADAFAVKEDIAFGGDGHAVDFFGGHGVLIRMRGQAAKTTRGLKWPLS